MDALLGEDASQTTVLLAGATAALLIAALVFLADVRPALSGLRRR